MAISVTLPELAEGVEKGDVVAIHAKAGDVVDEDSPLLEVESEKATLTVPANAKGRILRITVKPGDKVKVGQVIAELETAEGAPAPAAAAPEKAEPAKTAPAAEKSAEKKVPAKAAALAPAPAAAPAPPPPAVNGAAIPAGPAVRRIARELGIDLALVRGSGRNGRIVVEDLDPFIQGYIARHGGAVGAGVAPVELPDFSRFGPIRKEKADSLRRRISEKLTQAWVTVPHVHQQQTADITDLLALQKRLRARSNDAAGTLTLTPFLIKAIVSALKEFPQFNATFDSGHGEIIYKDYYHIGVAVDTPVGLMVPVLRDADKKPIAQLSEELAALAARARDRKVTPDDLRGGTFTLTNLGGIGGGMFNPIINVPEVAILGAGRATKQPKWTGSEFVPRDMLPLCLAYDHRVIDGADGARFILRIGEMLEHFEASILGF